MHETTPLSTADSITRITECPEISKPTLETRQISVLEMFVRSKPLASLQAQLSQRPVNFISTKKHMPILCVGHSPHVISGSEA